MLAGGKEDEQMHRRAKSVYDFYRAEHQPQAVDPGLPSPDLPSPNFDLRTPIPSTYTVVAEADHELWHPNYLLAIEKALARL